MLRDSTRRTGMKIVVMSVCAAFFLGVSAPYAFSEEAKDKAADVGKEAKKTADVDGLGELFFVLGASQKEAIELAFNTDAQEFWVNFDSNPLKQDPRFVCYSNRTCFFRNGEIHQVNGAILLKGNSQRIQRIFESLPKKGKRVSQIKHPDTGNKITTVLLSTSKGNLKVILEEPREKTGVDYVFVSIEKTREKQPVDSHTVGNSATTSPSVKKDNVTIINELVAMLKLPFPLTAKKTELIKSLSSPCLRVRIIKLMNLNLTLSKNMRIPITQLTYSFNNKNTIKVVTGLIPAMEKNKVNENKRKILFQTVRDRVEKKTDISRDGKTSFRAKIPQPYLDGEKSSFVLLFRPSGKPNINKYPEINLMNQLDPRQSTPKKD